MKSGSYHPRGSGNTDNFIGRYFTITNYGNIFSAYRHVSKNWGGGGCSTQHLFPSTESRCGNRHITWGNCASAPIKVVSDHLLEIDEFCRVPQIFIDVITITPRLFESTAFAGQDSYEHPHYKEKELKERFKILCRQYYKSQIETKSELSNLRSVCEMQANQLEEQQNVIKTGLTENEHLKNEIDQCRNAIGDIQKRQEDIITTLQDEHNKIFKAQEEEIDCQEKIIQSQQEENDRQREVIQSQKDDIECLKLSNIIEKQKQSWKPW